MLQCQSFNDSLLKYNFMTCYSLGFLFPGRFIKSRTYIINDTPHIKNIVMNCYNATFNDTLLKCMRYVYLRYGRPMHVLWSTNVNIPQKAQNGWFFYSGRHVNHLGKTSI